jgi:hypothetical protein
MQVDQSAKKNLYTWDEVKNLSTESDKRSSFVICDKLYSVPNEFLKDHPGGPEILMDFNGKDASEKFIEVYHSAHALGRLVEYEEGDIVENEKRNHLICRDYLKRGKKQNSFLNSKIKKGAIAFGVTAVTFVVGKNVIKKLAREQNAAIKRLRQRTGYSTWTLTPMGRKDALEASGFNIPAIILQQGLHYTLGWISNNNSLLLDAGRIRMYNYTHRVFKKSCTSKKTMSKLSALRDSTRMHLLDVFPKALEVLLTNHITGRRRDWTVVEDMSRFDCSFLGL